MNEYASYWTTRSVRQYSTSSDDKLRRISESITESLLCRQFLNRRASSRLGGDGGDDGDGDNMAMVMTMAMTMAMEMEMETMEMEMAMKMKMEMARSLQ